MVAAQLAEAEAARRRAEARARLLRMHMVSGYSVPRARSWMGRRGGVLVGQLQAQAWTFLPNPTPTPSLA